MTRAMELAEKGSGYTSPNPLVGAVVVRNGLSVAEGYHAYFGGPHAEVMALRKARTRARGATLYVTLEPCSSWGKTPPCVDQVIASQVSRVVIGSRDPNPKNYGQGIRKLKKAGIKVQVGILSQQVEKQNQGFFKAMRTGFPYVTLKMAQSLDGKIATSRGESRWISSRASRGFVHQLRSGVDAVLIGKNTVLEDNPRLQGLNGGQKPWRILLDPGKIPSNARIFEGPQLTLMAIGEKKLSRLVSAPASKNRIFIPVPEKNKKLGLRHLLKKLTSLGIHRLLVEGGGELAWSLIRERLVDRLIWIIAPKVIGGREAKTSVEGEGVERIEKAFLLKWEKIYRLGTDWVFECLPES